MFESLTSTLASLNPFASDVGAAAAPAPAPAFDVAAAAPAATGAGGGVVDWFKGLFDHGESSMGDVVKENRKELQEHFALESAKEQLKGKFQVGEGTGPNAVSPEEFEQIAKLYGNIRDGKSDLKLDTSDIDKDKQPEMRQKALDDMSTMLTTPAGRKLLGELSNNEVVDPNDPTKKIHRKTTLHLSDNKFDDNEADAEGMAAARGRDNEAANAIEARASTKGQGVNAVVNFHPGVTKMLDGLNVQSTGDTALFHELTHAYHMTHGTKINSTQTLHDEKSRDNGQRLEELATVGLGTYKDDFLTENEYRRERAQLDPSVQQRPTYH